MRLSHTLLCLTLLAPAAQGKELMRVYDLAAQNDPTLAAADHQRDAGREARPAALAAFLPQVTAGYQQSRSKQEQTTSSPCDFNTGATNCTFNFTNKGLSLTAQQSVFNWEAVQRLRQSSDRVALAEAGYRAAEQDLTLRTAVAFFNVLYANDSLRSAEAENKAVERQLEQAKKRFEVGLSAITDVQEAQARYDLTSSSLITAEQALSSAREALTTLTGPLETLRITGVQEDIPLPAPDPADVNAWVNAAREGNLNLLSARLNVEAGGKEVHIARARHLPTVGFQAQYSDGESGGRFGGEQQETSFALSLSAPIFSGGATQAGVRSAVATHEQLKSQYEGIKRAVDKETRDAYQGVISGAARVKALKQAVVSSTTALEASETGLQVGARTAVDVLNAQQQLYAAQRNYAQSRYDYLVNVLRLKAAAGRLGAQDVAEVDRLLVD